jgi:hypothetical protein
MNNYKMLENRPDVLTAKDLQNILHISRAGAYNLLNTPGFPTTTLGRSKRVMKNHLLDWLEHHTENSLNAL